MSLNDVPLWREIGIRTASLALAVFPLCANALTEEEIRDKAFEFSSRTIQGVPHEWQMGLQHAMSPMMEQLTSFHSALLVIITVISLLVLALMGYVCWRFRADRNPKPATFTHHLPLEIVWTAVPAIIVALIAVRSINVLYYVNTTPETELTLKVTGSQWYWSYKFPDHGIDFASVMLSDEDVKKIDKTIKTDFSTRGQKSAPVYRLLEVDNVLVLPTETNIRVQLTGADVIHAWAVPALGIKIDTVPGRLNETWMRIKKPGYYFGQCSELCGRGHGFMPISIKAVSREEFARWTKTAKEKFGSAVPTDKEARRYAEVSGATSKGALSTPGAATLSD